MDTVPSYVQIGAILGIVSSFVLLILHFKELVDTIRSFLKWFYGWLKWRWVLFRQWRWWRKYRPSFNLANVGRLKITEVNGTYHMELKIEVKYTSNDSRYPTRMDCSTLLLDVLNTGKGRDKAPYRLHNTQFAWRTSPPDESEEGGFPAVNPFWNLPCNAEWIIRYTFIGQMEVLPLVGETTFCKIVTIGKASIERVPSGKDLGVGDKFLVEIMKGYVS